MSVEPLKNKSTKSIDGTEILGVQDTAGVSWYKATIDSIFAYFNTSINTGYSITPVLADGENIEIIGESYITMIYLDGSTGGAGIHRSMSNTVTANDVSFVEGVSTVTFSVRLNSGIEFGGYLNMNFDGTKTVISNRTGIDINNVQIQAVNMNP